MTKPSATPKRSLASTPAAASSISSIEALKGDGRYHAIANARGMDPSGIALTAGLKTYF
jgi:hypothetical protein